MYKNGYHYRCRANGHRRTFSMPVGHYKIKDPVLTCHCGCETWTPDKYRDKVELRKNRCDCDGHHFPHRRGSKWCEHYKGEYTEQDYQDRYEQVGSSNLC